MAEFRPEWWPWWSPEVSGELLALLDGRTLARLRLTCRGFRDAVDAQTRLPLHAERLRRRFLRLHSELARARLLIAEMRFVRQSRAGFQLVYRASEYRDNRYLGAAMEDALLQLGALLDGAPGSPRLRLRGDVHLLRSGLLQRLRNLDALHICEGHCSTLRSAESELMARTRRESSDKDEESSDKDEESSNKKSTPLSDKDVESSDKEFASLSDKMSACPRNKESAPLSDKEENGSAPPSPPDDAVVLPPGLRALALVGVRLRTIEGNVVPPSVAVLDLRDNELASLAGLRLPPALHTLRVSINRLETLDPAARLLPPGLRRLEVDLDTVIRTHESAGRLPLPPELELLTLRRTPGAATLPPQILAELHGRELAIKYIS